MNIFNERKKKLFWKSFDQEMFEEMQCMARTLLDTIREKQYPYLTQEEFDIVKNPEFNPDYNYRIEERDWVKREIPDLSIKQQTIESKQEKKSDNILKISVWQKAICTRLNWDKFTVEVYEIEGFEITGETFYHLIILDGEHKWKYSLLAQSELDSSIEFLPLNN